MVFERLMRSDLSSDLSLIGGRESSSLSVGNSRCYNSAIHSEFSVSTPSRRNSAGNFSYIDLEGRGLCFSFITCGKSGTKLHTELVLSN